MKNVMRALVGIGAALGMTLVAPVHAGQKQLNQSTKDKLAQLIAQHLRIEDLGGRPRFERRHIRQPAIGAAATAAVASGRRASDGIISVPHFDFTAVSGGQRFPLMFVGSRPQSHGATTIVKNIIIPIAVTVPLLDANLNPTGAEVTFDGASKVPNTLRSPIYRGAQFAVPPQAGTTQWGDAMQRTTFFQSLRPNTDSWHVLLGDPLVVPTINTGDFFDGFAVDFGDGTPLFAFMAGEFIDGIIATYLATNPLPADVVPIFVTYNTLLFYGGDPVNGCCVLGYHDALVLGSHGTDTIVQTFMFADWNDADIFTVPIQDIHALSHEVAEWLNDPFINNVVPPYANGEGTGCDTIMETGDQLVGHTVPVTLRGFTYHPQTQDILQWFTRETPSSALGGLYIFPDDRAVPNKPAPACTP